MASGKGPGNFATSFAYVELRRNGTHSAVGRAELPEVCQSLRQWARLEVFARGLNPVDRGTVGTSGFVFLEDILFGWF